MTRELMPGHWPKVGAVAQAVRCQYHAQVPEPFREVRFSESSRADDCWDADRKRFERYLRLESPELIPADLVPAWIAPLPAEEAWRAKAALCDLLGLLPVPKPDASASGDARYVAQMTRRFAGTLDALAPILEDGAIREDDAEHIPAAVAQVDQLMGVLTAMRGRLLMEQQSAALATAQAQCRPVLRGVR